MRPIASRSRAASQFWAVADLFRGRPADWMPTNAGYEFRRTVDVDGKRWTMCFKVHVLQEKHGVEREQVRFKSSISLWPPSLTKVQEKRLRQRGWYVANEELLSRAGYEGKWYASPDGTFGDFWKDLATLSEVRLEAKRLETMRIALPSSPRKRSRKSTER
jgi:hypothetical protein